MTLLSLALDKFNTEVGNEPILNPLALEKYLNKTAVM